MSTLLLEAPVEVSVDQLLQEAKDVLAQTKTASLIPEDWPTYPTIMAWDLSTTPQWSLVSTKLSASPLEKYTPLDYPFPTWHLSSFTPLSQGYYSFTMDDLWSYLEPLGDDAVIGLAGDVLDCMVARAIRHKYPEAQRVVVGGFGGTNVNGQPLSLPSEVYHAVKIFDNVGTHKVGLPPRMVGSVPVTKGEFMQAWGARSFPSF